MKSLEIKQKLTEMFSRFFRKLIRKSAVDYLRKNGLLDILASGDSQEFLPCYEDLARLHKLIRIKKPKCVLELGIGFSTIIISRALADNEADGSGGHCHTVEAEKNWIENTKAKMSPNLLKRTSFHHRSAEVMLFNGCHVVSCFKDLPDICPDFIYVDGPNHDSVLGSHNSLSFKNRPILNIEPLMYESSAPTKFTILVDGRWRVARFLTKYLYRDYKITRRSHLKYHLFEAL